MGVNKTLIALPIYHLRNSKLIDFFRNCNDDILKNFDITIFTCHDDTTDYSYIINQKITQQNIYIPYDENADKYFCAISYKRQQILKYAKDKGYKYCVMIDDDINPVTAKITPDSKRTTSDSYAHVKINIIDNINKMIQVADEQNSSFTSCQTMMYLSFSKPETIKINERVNCMQFYMINVKDIFDNDISYSYNEQVTDDIDIALQILQHGLKCVTLLDYAYKEDNTDIYKSTIHENIRAREMQHIGIFKKWHTTLYLDKHGIIRTKMKWIKYFNTFELPEMNKFQKEVLELVENNAPYEVIYNKLLNKK